jgi:type I restriction enzyme M protein
MTKVTLLNPRTCGIYKDGGPRFKTDPRTGLRTNQIDNQLLEHVESYLKGKTPDGAAKVVLADIFRKQNLVPTYYDDRYNENIRELLKAEGLTGMTLGELLDAGTLAVRGGHGSPGNDQRSGHIPYVKVSDIRGLRININPTNLVTESIARRFWSRGQSRPGKRKNGATTIDSGLRAWDLITPNRASSNIGEFAILLPGEESLVLTKEVFVFRVANPGLFDHFYLLWAFCLRAVRDQWRRIALMQTNREDCGDRYLEIILPKPKGRAWADKACEAFRNYFTSLDGAKATFVNAVSKDKYGYIANVASGVPLIESDATKGDGSDSDD